MYLVLNDIKRNLATPLPLMAIMSHTCVAIGRSGRRYNDIEFTIRLSSPDEFAFDVQDGIKTKLKFPHIYIKHPNSDFQPPPFEPREAIAIIFSGDLCDHLVEQGILLDEVGWEFELNSEISELIAKLKELFEKVMIPNYVDRIDSYALALLKEIMLQHPRQQLKANPDNFYLEKIQAIASYFRYHYTEDISIDKLCQQHGLSRRTFFRYWRKFFTHTPRQYILELRLQEAKRLLQSRLTISEIALHLKFEDISNFTAKYHRFYGETPSAFRKKFIK